MSEGYPAERFQVAGASPEADRETVGAAPGDGR